jgi:hypothetical protein
MSNPFRVEVPGPLSMFAAGFLDDLLRRGYRPSRRVALRARSRQEARAGLERIYSPLQQQVKARGLWAAHLDPELAE